MKSGRIDGILNQSQLKSQQQTSVNNRCHYSICLQQQQQQHRPSSVRQFYRHLVVHFWAAVELAVAVDDDCCLHDWTARRLWTWLLSASVQGERSRGTFNNLHETYTLNPIIFFNWKSSNNKTTFKRTRESVQCNVFQTMSAHAQ